MPITNENEFRFVAEENVSDFVDEKDKILFSDANTFSQYIELRAVKEKKSCADVLLQLCAEKDLEPDDIKELISKPLKSKLIVDLTNMGLVKKTSTLFD